MNGAGKGAGYCVLTAVDEPGFLLLPQPGSGQIPIKYKCGKKEGTPAQNRGSIGKERER